MKLQGKGFDFWRLKRDLWGDLGMGLGEYWTMKKKRRMVRRNSEVRVVLKEEKLKAMPFQIIIGGEDQDSLFDKRY